MEFLLLKFSVNVSATHFLKLVLVLQL